MFLPDNIRVLLGMLNEAGFRAYAVGGCVRDSVMGQSADDYDITTTARPEEIKQVFSGYRTIDIGEKHGTIVVISGGSPIEITTHRMDGNYSDSRHPDSVTFTDSLREDLARRDFTVNAIAYSQDGGVVDPFGGMEDIQNKVIRCVGDPVQRFSEDALRIMRALRFSSVLDFTIEPNTAKAIFEQKANLQKVSAERLQKELMKLLRGKNVLSVLLTYGEVLFELFPSLAAEYRHPQKGKKHAYDVWEHTCHTVASIDPTDDYLRLTMLFHDIGKPAVETFRENGDSDFTNHAAVGAQMAEKELQRLKFPTRTIETVTYLVSIHDRAIPDNKPALKRYLREMGEENFLRFLKIRRADRGALAEGYRDISDSLNRALTLLEQIKNEKECYTLSSLAVSGEEIQSVFSVSGKAVGQLLERALDAVIDEKCDNQANAIINYLKGETK